MSRTFAILGFCALCVAPALASEDLVSGLSQDTVEITSNYTGTDIVVFGAIEHLEDVGAHDVIVVVRGPDADMTVRKKDRVVGIWLNRDQAKLQDMPTFYYLASTRPLGDIAARDTLKRYGIGLANLKPDRIFSHHDPEPFRQALIRHKEQDGLYGEAPDAVQFLSPALFRVHVPVPATVTRGQYNAEVYLFRNGAVEAVQTQPLFVDQVGIERRVFNMAHQWSLLYGLTAVLMAAFLGWLSSVIFRRPI
jgi:uncharacterized protein (TIGR02186 family)